MKMIFKISLVMRDRVAHDRGLFHETARARAMPRLIIKQLLNVSS